MGSTTIPFWSGVQRIAGDSHQSWTATQEALSSEYVRSSAEVREQMRRDVERAVGRLIMIDRTLNAQPAESFESP
jgi:hypothetical protein